MTYSYAKLGDIATYINGYAFKPKDHGTKGLPIIRIQDLTGSSNDRGYYAGEYPSKIEINNGDVLISWSASLGVYVWNKGKALLNQHIFKVKFDKKDIDKDYFVYAVRFNLTKLKQLTHGATMKHVVKKDFENVLIPYPSLKRQREIAYVLDKLERNLTQKSQELDKLDELIKARFVELFGDLTTNNRGWKTENFSCVFENITSSKRILKSEWKSNGIPFLRVRDLVQLSEKEVLNNEFFISSELYSRLSDNDGVPKNGDILVSATSTLGKCHIVNSNEKLYFKDADVLRFRPSNKINAVYFTECMNDHFIQGQIEHNLGVTTVKHFTIKAAKSILIRIPPLSLQNKFANFVQQVDKSKFENIVYLNKTLSMKILSQLGDVSRD